MAALVVTLNLIATIFLSFAVYHGRKRQISAHKRYVGLTLLTACLLLAVFLYDKIVLSDSLRRYVTEGFSGSTGFKIFLILHIFASVITLPLLAITIRMALKQRHTLHKKWAKRTLAIWYYASITGIMLYAQFAFGSVS